MSFPFPRFPYGEFPRDRAPAGEGDRFRDRRARPAGDWLGPQGGTGRSRRGAEGCGPWTSWAIASGWAALLYLAAAGLGAAFAAPAGGLPVLWLPAGVALAALLRSGGRPLPGLALAAWGCAAVYLRDRALHLPPLAIAVWALVLAGGALLGAIAPWIWLRRIARPEAVLARLNHVLVFGAAVAAGSALSAGWIATVLLWCGAIPADDWTATGLAWGLSRVLGQLALAPPLLVWSETRVRRDLAVLDARRLEAIALLGLTVVASWAVFARGYPAESALLLLLFWSTVRFGKRVTAAIALVTVAAAAAATARGFGPFSAAPWGVQGFVAALSIAWLVLSAALDEREAALAAVVAEQRSSLALKDAFNAALQTANATLDRRVSERTAQLESANRTLHRLAHQDGLTEIANRYCFDRALDGEWQRARRSGRSLGLVLCDVDFFKRYNDAWGHPAGDRCLRHLAGALASVARRPGDLVARYGGEEFALLLPDTDAAGALEVAERARAAVADLALPHPDSPVGPCVTLSLGAASGVPEPGRSPKDWVAAADRALYAAKAAGRDRCVLAGD